MVKKKFIEMRDLMSSLSLKARRHDFGIGLSFIIVLLVCYLNSFEASWHYDDFTNIVSNEKVHMTELSLKQLRAVLNAGWEYQIISRPLSYLSFALNHRWGGLNVFGYHLINWLIHVLTTIFLYLFIRDTLKLPVLKNRYAFNEKWIAWIAAMLWAIHPIQVTAVTYIVQRMTSMAGLLYILSMYSYLRGRLARGRFEQIIGFGFCGLFAFLALLTKENSVMLFYAMLLYEFLFLAKEDRRSIKKFLMMSLGLSIALFFVSMIYTNPLRLFIPYANRPFTIWERLLTQPRVLLIYLSIIAVPMTARLSLFHDLDISHSLLDPWTTLFSLVAVAAAFFWLLIYSRKYPLVTFCGLFFFLNHAVESSVLNLELFYEHRNYIPSMMLFVPIAAGAVASFQYFYYRPVLKYCISALSVMIMATFVYLTIEYNQAFETEFSLWSHAVVRYPKASLAHNNLGKVYWSLGLFDKSYEEIQTAIQLDRFHNVQQKGTAYYNLGIYEAYKQRDFLKALDSFMKAKAVDNGDPLIWHEIARACMQTSNDQASKTILEAAMQRWPENAETMNLMATFYIKQHDYGKAMEIAGDVLKKDPENDMASIIMGQSYRYLGDSRSAILYWAKVSPKSPFGVIACLSLMDIYCETGDYKISELLDKEFNRRIQKKQESDMVEFCILNHAILPFCLNKALGNRAAYSVE